MMIQAVFFDVGDTLVSDFPSLEDRIWTASVACGIVYDRDDLIPGLRREEDYVLARYVNGETLDHPGVMLDAASVLLAEVGAGAADVGRAADLVDAFLAIPVERFLHPDALALIDLLKGRGFTVGVISDWNAKLPDLLEALSVLSRLDALAVSSLVGCTKPDPRLFEAALAQACVDAGMAVHVGDFYELDVAGARAAGMDALLFDWRGRVPNADCHRVETFAGVADFLCALPSPTP